MAWKATLAGTPQLGMLQPEGRRRGGHPWARGSGGRRGHAAVAATGGAQAWGAPPGWAGRGGRRGRAGWACGQQQQWKGRGRSRARSAAQAWQRQRQGQGWPGSRGHSLVLGHGKALVLRREHLQAPALAVNLYCRQPHSYDQQVAPPPRVVLPGNEKHRPPSMQPPPFRQNTPRTPSMQPPAPIRRRTPASDAAPPFRQNTPHPP